MEQDKMGFRYLVCLDLNIFICLISVSTYDLFALYRNRKFWKALNKKLHNSNLLWLSFLTINIYINFKLNLLNTSWPVHDFIHPWSARIQKSSLTCGLKLLSFLTIFIVVVNKRILTGQRNEQRHIHFV